MQRSANPVLQSVCPTCRGNSADCPECCGEGFLPVVIFDLEIELVPPDTDPEYEEEETLLDLMGL